ncbi:MAG TPA: hypothetical protein VJN18_14690 [Polyangiaceae bacterium]|nr:hypothetical protein [Polyangiaceae bacterium]
MKAAKAWCVAGLLVLTGLVSCGKDEARGGDEVGGQGTIIGGGGNSTAGNLNEGGTTMAGTAGSTVGALQTKLGSGCINDGQCADTKAPGLKCVTATDAVLGPGAPPKGVCTIGCDRAEITAENPLDPCELEFGTGAALCYPFDAGSDLGYCMESCTFGQPEIGKLKCHDRAEFACNPALLGATQDVCTETTDCGAGELCIDGTCAIVTPACLPSCRGDLDCADGMYCDQSFLSGVCLTEKPTGKALGEPCAVVPEGQPAEPDECLGFCQADAVDSTTGHCAATCGLLSECAWNAETEKFDGACFYASVLTSETGFVGDFGFCTPACNCPAECNDPRLTCSLLTQVELTDAFKGLGLCFSPPDPPDPNFQVYDECAGSMGGGGAGDGGAPAASGGGGAGG